MKRKHLIIIAAILLVIIAGGIGAYLFLDRNTQEADEFDFLPESYMLDPDSLSETTLTIYINGVRTSKDEEVLEAVNKKLRDDLKTRIEFKYYWEYYPQFLARVERDNASGITCDAFLFNKEFQTTVKAIADQGLAMDVSRLFPEYAPNYYNQFTSEEMKAMTIEGKIYLIPPRMPSTNMRYAVVRQDLMEKYKIPEIKSYDDFEVFLDAIVKNEPDLTPVRYKDTSMVLFADMYGYVILDYITGLVYKWDDPAMKLMTWDQTPEFTEALDRLKRWYDNGYLGAENNMAAGFTIINGKYEYVIYDHMITDLKAASFLCGPDEQIRMNILLRGKGITDIYYKAYPLHDGYSQRDTIMEAGVIVNPVSQQAERVLMFIDWLQSDQENYDLLMYGQKDVHYIDKGDYAEPPKDAVVTFNDWSWRPAFENIDYRRANFPGQKAELDHYNSIVRERTRMPPHYGFTPDYSAVKDIYERIFMKYTWPEDTIYNGYDYSTMIEWFRKEQSESGVNGLISEIQGQLDEYIRELNE